MTLRAATSVSRNVQFDLGQSQPRGHGRWLQWAINTTIDSKEVWHMTDFDGFMLGAGWLFLAGAVTFLVLLLALQSRRPIWLLVTHLEHTKGWRALCTAFLKSHIDPAVVGLGVMNFVLFAMVTEVEVNSHSPMMTPRAQRVIVQTCEFAEHVSTVFLLAATILRVISRSGRGRERAVLCLLLLDPFMWIDYCSFVPGLYNIFTGTNRCWNTTWLSMARALAMAGQQTQTRAGLWKLSSILDEGRGALVVFMWLAGAFWLVMSGLYYLANRANEESRWDAAVYQGQYWQRFESIPSSMFFVLLNFVREDPIAEVFRTPFSRLLVVVVALIGVPVFAVPTGFLGSALLTQTRRSLEVKARGAAEDVSLEAAAAGTTSFLRLLPLFTAIFSLLPIIAFFYFTCGPTTLLWVQIHVQLPLVLSLEGLATVAFLAEWLARLSNSQRRLFGPLDYVASAAGLLDFLAWCPGLALLLQVLSTGHLCAPLQAMCVLRIFKLERYVGAFGDMWRMLAMHGNILGVTFLLTLTTWISFSVALWITERESSDIEVRVSYASVPRSLWTDVIILHGEWPTGDFSAFGKCFCTFIALFSRGVAMLPIAIFTDGFMTQLRGEQGRGEELDENEAKPWSLRPAWQLGQRPKLPGPAQEAFDRLYAHLLPESALQHVPEGYLTLKAVSISLTLFSVLVTIVASLSEMGPEECSSQKCRAFLWALYTADGFLSFFFTFELLYRLRVLGLPYLCSFLGLCDVLAMGGFWLTLCPFRERLLHPVYEYADGLVIPIRMLRIFLLEHYSSTGSVLQSVVWQQRVPLLKAFYALMATWYLFATLLWVFEKDSEDPEMALRFSNVLTGMPLSLICLTGDYPVPVMCFSVPSCFIHAFFLVLGMCCTASFTGIFSASFVEYLESERAQRRLETSKKRLYLFRVAAAVMSHKSRRQESKRRAVLKDMEELSPRKVRSCSSFSGKEDQRSLLRRWAREMLAEKTHTAKVFMGTAYAALVTDIVITVVMTIPQVGATVGGNIVFQPVVVLCQLVFIVEYVTRLLASTKPMKTALRPPRLLDAFCLLPSIFRLLFDYFAGFSRRAQLHTADGLIDVAKICRVVRILQLPCIREQIMLIRQTLVVALPTLRLPATVALYLWVFCSALWVFLENQYDGPQREEMASIPDAMYWSSIYLLGEWPHDRFSDGAGSRLCIFFCLVGVALFAVPVGSMVEAVHSTLLAVAEEKKVPEAEAEA